MRKKWHERERLIKFLDKLGNSKTFDSILTFFENQARRIRKVLLKGINKLIKAMNPTDTANTISEGIHIIIENLKYKPLAYKAAKYVLQFSYFLSSILISVFVLAILAPTIVAISVIAVLVAHELGHFLTGIYFQKKAWLPFFVPFVFFIIGMTYIPDSKHIPWVAIAGPLAGISTALIIAIFAFSLDLPLLFTVCMWMIVHELVSATVGKDGAMFRRAIRLRIQEKTTHEIDSNKPHIGFQRFLIHMSIFVDSVITKLISLYQSVIDAIKTKGMKIGRKKEFVYNMC